MLTRPDVLFLLFVGQKIQKQRRKIPLLKLFCNKLVTRAEPGAAAAVGKYNYSPHFLGYRQSAPDSALVYGNFDIPLCQICFFTNHSFQNASILDVAVRAEAKIKDFFDFYEQPLFDLRQRGLSLSRRGIPVKHAYIFDSRKSTDELVTVVEVFGPDNNRDTLVFLQVGHSPGTEPGLNVTFLSSGSRVILSAGATWGNPFESAVATNTWPMFWARAIGCMRVSGFTSRSSGNYPISG